MKDKHTIKDKKPNLKPLYLSCEEAEIRKQEYNSIIEKNYPNLKNVNQPKFKAIRDNIKDKNAQKEFKNVVLKFAFDEVVNTYLNYDIKGCEFEDSLQDVYLMVESRFNQFLNIEYLSMLKFFVQRTTHRSVKAKISRMARKNLDILYSLDDKLSKDANMDNIPLNNIEDAEFKQLYEEFRDIVEKCMDNLSPRYKKVVSLYYGLNGHEQLSISEIAEKYGLTNSMIHKHIKDAKTEFKKYFKIENLKNNKSKNWFQAARARKCLFNSRRTSKLCCFFVYC